MPVPKNILFATDFSQNSRHAVQYVYDLVKQSDSGLHVLHVVNHQSEFKAEEQFERFGQMLSHSEQRQQKIKWVTATGNPAVAIAKYARDNDIDMIAMGSHGRTGLKRVLMGSVAEVVVRQADCPVLVIKANRGVDDESTNGRDDEKGVLCAIDVHDYDQQVIDLAACYAKQFAVDLDLIHVTISPDPAKAAWPGYVGAPDELIRDEHLLQELATTIGGVKVQRHHTSGFPVQKVLDFAETHHPQLLVLGTHARTGVNRVLGSIAARIMRKASCPVMVLRQRQNSQVCRTV